MRYIKSTIIKLYSIKCFSKILELEILSIFFKNKSDKSQIRAAFNMKYIYSYLNLSFNALIIK